MNKILFLLMGLILSMKLTAQNDVIAFFEYDIKDGMTDQFITGYAKDLEWHQSQEDDWSWFGWFVINGERRGRFIDATPSHAWSDFDNWKVDAIENARHNKIHWSTYVVNPGGSYKILINEHSSSDKNWMTNSYLQVYTLKVKNGQVSAFEEFLAGFKISTKQQGLSFVWMKTISGGSVLDYQLFVGLSGTASLALCSDLFYFSDFQSDLAKNYVLSVESNTSELWKYSPKLSLLSSQ